MQLAASPPVLLLPLILSAGCGDNQAGSSRWVGKTYLLDIPAANWTEPRGIGRDIGDFVPQFLLGVEPASPGYLAVTVGTAADGVQDPCNTTTQVMAADA